MRTQNAARALFVGFLALTLYLMYLIFRPFLPGIAWAVVLVIAFTPVHARLVRLLRGRALAASVLMSVVIAAIIVVPAVVVVVKVGQGVADGYEWLRQTFEQRESPIDILQQKIPWLADAIDKIDDYVDLSAIDLKAMALSATKTLGNALAGKTASLVANALSTMLTLVIMLVTMTVLFQEGPRLVETMRRVLPLSETDRNEVLNDLRGVTRAVFFGVLLTALVQAILGGIGTKMVGLPAPFTFGAAIFFAALLPIGAAVVWAPAAAWLLATGHPWRALILAIWGLVVVSMADNVLRPFFIGKGVRMHTLLVFFGIFGGILAFGLIGVFIGPLIITAFLFLFGIARRDLFREAFERPLVVTPGDTGDRDG